MPKKRLENTLWQEKRKQVWIRDNKQCQSPLKPPICIGKPFIAFTKCHIDHIQSGKFGTNKLSNLRVLCPACHALRLDHRHRGLISKALRKNWIPPNWRELVWE
jgi:5-methylcytosine-specific restriction protein A